jgi:hypothetical protein
MADRLIVVDDIYGRFAIEICIHGSGLGYCSCKPLFTTSEGIRVVALWQNDPLAMLAGNPKCTL